MRVHSVKLSYPMLRADLAQLKLKHYKVIKLDNNLRSSFMKARTGFVLKALKLITINDDKKLLKAKPTKIVKA